MLRPRRMSRVLVTGSLEKLEPAIEALHGERSLHITDYTEQYEGFRIGAPLERAERDSEKLLKLRSASKALGIVEGATDGARLRSAQAREKLDGLIKRLEKEVGAPEKRRQELESSLRELEKRSGAVGPFVRVPLSFEDLRPYESLAVFTGTARRGFEGELGRLAKRHLLVWPDPEGILALFVEKEKEPEVARLLARHGFAEVRAPPESGRPAEVLAGIEREMVERKRELEALGSQLRVVQKELQDEILACSEELAIDIEKSESPLRFATTGSAFVIEGWIPADRLDATENALLKATGNRILLERLEEAEWKSTGALTGKAAPAARPDGEARKVPQGKRGAEDGGGPKDADEGEDDPYASVPIALDNAGPVKPFETLTEMFALPSYKELDPTTLLAFIFPFFFGLMVGDVGYGVLLVMTGVLFRWKLKRYDGFPQMGAYIIAAGLVASVLGLFIFGEAFGVPFHAAEGHGAAGEVSWYTLTGIDVPLRASVHKLESSGLGTLMVFSILAGIFHLCLGNLLGMANAWRHSKRHAAGKFGWLLVVVGFGLLVLKVGDRNVLGAWVWSGLPAAFGLSLDTGVGILLPYSSLAFLGAGVVLAVAGEGGAAILEVLGALSNLLSYTRLAAIGVAKAAMAFAFNGMLLPLVTGGDVGWVIFGWLLLVVAHFLVFVLGAVSAGIQALRLNLVEFFMKFYKGGGIKFNPFGYVRRHTSD